MAVLSWGKPKLEIVALVDGVIPGSPTWVELETPVENTTKLNTTKGDVKEAKEEGGAIVDKKVTKNSYSLEFELFAKRTSTKPITDSDGLIVDNYAIRLTPEDATLKGFIIENSAVSVENTWDSETGEKWKYTFEALAPASGNMLKPFTAS